MSMLGFRDLVFIAPNPSQAQPFSADHHANLPLPSSSSSAALSVGLGIFPLLTATPCMPQPQPQPQPQSNTNDNVHNHNQDCGNGNNNPSFWNLKMCPPQLNSSDRKAAMMINVEEENGGVYGSDYRVCQDCGNRAKKDCSYKRCRTCCKGRGFDCNTHVRSTWIPLSHRRERHAVADGGSGGDSDGGGASSGAKRPRSSQNAGGATSHSSTATNAAMSRSLSLDTASCHQDAGFKQCLPGNIRAPAEFKCLRVSGIGNGEDEFAYMATVRISGHVFKGFLYDQGVSGRNEMPCVSELQLGNNGSGKSNRECASPIGVPTSVFPASAC